MSAITLNAYPPNTKEYFDILIKCGATHFALFGGAVRDADYSAYHNKQIHINDHDIRVVGPFVFNSADPDSSDPKTTESFDDFLKSLEKELDCKYTLEPSPGTDRVRYVFRTKIFSSSSSSSYERPEDTLDISFRHVSQKVLSTMPVENVALDRITKCDIGLSAVAIDPKMQAWALDQYIMDRNDKTLTIFMINDRERRLTYAERLKKKFPDHTILEYYFR